MALPQLSKLMTRVRFPLPAPRKGYDGLTVQKFQPVVGEAGIDRQLLLTGQKLGDGSPVFYFSGPVEYNYLRPVHS